VSRENGETNTVARRRDGQRTRKIGKEAGKGMYEEGEMVNGQESLDKKLVKGCMILLHPPFIFLGCQRQLDYFRP
jgi:hypothetical protein